MVKWLKDDWILKVLSLLVALGIWFNAKTDQTSYYTIKAKINIRNFPKEYILAKKLPDKIDIKIYGKIKDIMFTKYITAPTVFVNGNTLRRGENIVYIEKSSINLPKPDKIKIAKVIPSYLTIVLDRKSEKKVGIVPYVSGTPKEGYVRSGGVKVIPNKISLFGPEKMLKDIKYVNTTKIDINGKSKTVDKYLNLALPDSLNIYSNVDSIRVIVPISRLSTRKIDSVAIAVQTDKYKIIDVKPKFISLILSGSDYVIDSLIKAGINAYVVVDVNAPGEYLLPVFINLPGNIYKQEITPEFVTVKVVK